MIHIPADQWRTSSRSGDSGQCVEIAGLPGAVAVRDSKNPGAGHLTLAPAAFASIIADVKAGRLHLR